MKMDLTKKEQELVLNYRKENKIDKTSIPQMVGYLKHDLWDTSNGEYLTEEEKAIELRKLEDETDAVIAQYRKDIKADLQYAFEAYTLAMRAGDKFEQFIDQNGRKYWVLADKINAKKLYLEDCELDAKWAKEHLRDMEKIPAKSTAVKKATKKAKVSQ